jgi:isoaspartyl peptidase/L-asparaginase-like protein (Ntn-hydrolase superfamily)
MPIPIMLSTWTFGLIANRAGFPYLTAPHTALDAVERACIAVESDESVDSVGIGGSPDAIGQVTLDGCIMTSPAQAAGVAYVRRFAHPVSIARKVMEQTSHKLVVGEGADRFADTQGFPPDILITDPARARWHEWAAAGSDAERRQLIARIRAANREELNRKLDPESAPHNKHHDTVGVLAIDSSGLLAGACSTSGLPFKLPGRVGDSPIIGHALYVDPKAGAAVTTGNGELMMGTCAAFLAVERMRLGDSPESAVRAVLQRIQESYPLTPTDQCGLIVLKPDGQWSAGALQPGFRIALSDPSDTRLVDPPVIWQR